MAAQRPVNVADYERSPREALPQGPLGYYAGGAGGRAHAAREHRGLGAPRACARACSSTSSAVSTATTVLGTPVASPVLVAPTALQRMAHPDGEPGMARAAADAGTIMTLSTLAHLDARRGRARPPRARRAGTSSTSRRTAASRSALADAAVDAGFTAIVVTVDAPVPGRRERDFRTGFRVPPDLDMPAITRRARTQRRRHGRGLLLGHRPDASPGRDLERFAADCPLPVLVKGDPDRRGRRAGLRARRRRRRRLQPRRAPARRRRGDGRDAARGRRRGRRAARGARRRRHPPRHRRARRARARRARGARRPARRCGAWPPAARPARATCSACCRTRSRAGSRCSAARHPPR